MTLSIFSFDKLRAAMRLPLRKHLWHAWLVITLIAIMTFASTILSTFDTSPPPRQRTYANLEQKEIILLGDSQVAIINENALAIPAKNLADGGMAYRIQYAFLKYYAPQMSELRTVLIGYNNIMLRNPDIERRRGDYRTVVNSGLPWYHIPVSWRERIEYVISYQDYFKPLLVGPRPGIEHLAEWDFLQKVGAETLDSNKKPQDARNVYQVNFTSAARTKKFGIAPVDGARKMRAYMDAYRDPEVERRNRRAFFEILEYCSARRLEVVLLRTPTTQGYRTARSDEWKQALVNLLAEARAKFPDLALPVWDAESTEHVSLELFRDPNHMWPEGCARFAEYLNQRLQETPYRDDSDGLVYDPAANHLHAWDPRENIWGGFKDKENNIARVAVPAKFLDKFTEAFRVTIPAGGHIRQSDLTPVAPGVEVTASIWLWKNKAADTRGLRMHVLRDGEGPVFGNGIDVPKLGEEPQAFTVAHTFTQTYEATRLQITNPTEQAITFIMAAPSLTRQ